MWTLSSRSTVWIAHWAPPCRNAWSILPLPPVQRRTQRSRGIESMVTCRVDPGEKHRLGQVVALELRIAVGAEEEERERRLRRKVLARRHRFELHGAAQRGVDLAGVAERDLDRGHEIQRDAGDDRDHEPGRDEGSPGHAPPARLQ